MAKPYAVGDVVVCRFFSRYEGRFHGSLFEATILTIAKTIDPRKNKQIKKFYVKRKKDGWEGWLQRKEIKGRLSQK